MQPTTWLGALSKREYFDCPSEVIGCVVKISTALFFQFGSIVQNRTSIRYSHYIYISKLSIRWEISHAIYFLKVTSLLDSALSKRDM